MLGWHDVGGIRRSDGSSATVFAGLCFDRVDIGVSSCLRCIFATLIFSYSLRFFVDGYKFIFCLIFYW